MIPAHMHMQVDVLFNAGKLLIKKVGEPGAQGATVAGTQGMGVNTPNLAAVAAITTGLVGAEQRPNGMILTKGAKSIMLAARGPVTVMGGPFGTTFSTLGNAPKLHLSVAPEQTCNPMAIASFTVYSSHLLRSPAPTTVNPGLE